MQGIEGFMKRIASFGSVARFAGSGVILLS
jgi:hypothetical protein